MAPNWKHSRCPLVDKWLNKLVHPYHEILFSKKWEHTIDASNNLDEYPENYVETEKSVTKSCILYDSIYNTFLKLQHYRNGEQISVLVRGQRWGRGTKGDGCGSKRSTGIPVATEMFCIFFFFFNIYLVLLGLSCSRWAP